MKERLAPLRAHYAAGHTRSLDARRKALAALRRSIVAHTDELFEALHTDLGKSDRESYMSEVGVALAEIDHLSRHLRRLMRPRRVRGSLTIFPSRCRVVAEPLGLVLIISQSYLRSMTEIFMRS
jgi:aldehyde dehydrogenase (NAD+)